MITSPPYYQDTYLSRVAPNTNITQYTGAMIDTTPRWMHGLFHLHDTASKPLGEKQQQYSYTMNAPKVGDKIGPFPITGIYPDRVECMRQDKNLDFYSTYQMHTLASGERAVSCTTRIIFKNKRGKAYFKLLLKPFHRWLLPKLMGKISNTPPVPLSQSLIP